ncbi:hypothetical protein BHE74_00017516 [Ensete ventricosum]|nr:hypothetical protein BHE74_00017516 [Ensete ventricosum]
MASSVSFTSSGPSSSIPLPQAEERRPCNPEEGQSKPPSSSSAIMTRTDVRAFKALEIMTLCHDFNSTVSVESLVAVQKCYSIPNEYALYDPLLRKRPYHTYPERFSIFVDALEAGLRIPLHPVIGNASAGWGEDALDLLLEPPTPPAIAIAQLSPESRKFEQRWWPRRVSKPLAGDRPRKVHAPGRRSKSRTDISLDMEKRVPSLMRPRARNGSELLANTNPPSRRPKSMKDLCLTSAGEGDEGYYALRMTDLSSYDLEASLEARWSTLKQGTQVWVDGMTSTEYAWGVLIPWLATELYSSPSEVLVDQALKTLVSSDRPIDNKAEGLQREIAELKVGSGPEAIVTVELRASKAQDLTNHLKTELKEANRRRESLEMELDNSRLLLTNSQEQLKDVWAQGRVMEDELLKMTRAMEGLRVKLPKEAIPEYKKSVSFEMGLVQTGQVSYEYGYRVALARFRAR